MNAEEQVPSPAAAINPEAMAVGTEPEGEAGGAAGSGSLTLWAKVSFIALSCSMVVAAGYHMLVRSQLPLPIATVDLQSVVEAKELQFTDIVTRAGATDADRDRAFQLVASLGGELETAVNELRNECRCMVLVRAAVVGSAPNDLTGALRKKMGVSEVDVAALRERLRQTRMAPSSAASSQTPQSLSELLGVTNGRPPR